MRARVCVRVYVHFSPVNGAAASSSSTTSSERCTGDFTTCSVLPCVAVCVSPCRGSSVCVAAAGGEMGRSTTAAHNNTVTVLASWPRNHNSNNSHSNNNNFADCTKQPAFVCVRVYGRPACTRARERAMASRV